MAVRRAEAPAMAGRATRASGSAPRRRRRSGGAGRRRRAPSRGRVAPRRAAATGGRVLRWWQQLLLFVGLSAGLAVLTYVYRDAIAGLGSWGYLGAFVINGISSATIFFPAPGAAVIMVMARDYDPLLLGVVSGLGGALGSSTSYLMGRYTVQGIRRWRVFPAVQWFMDQFGGLVLFLVNAIPFLPSDAIGILAGLTRYPLERYFFWMSLGSIVKMVALLYGFNYAFDLSAGLVNQWLGPLGWQIK